MYLCRLGYRAEVPDRALGAKPTGRAAHVLTRIGFRLRPLEVETSNDDYTAAVAYQGAIAYVYLANRAICREGQKCDWSKPPRFRPLATARITVRG